MRNQNIKAIVHGAQPGKKITRGIGNEPLTPV